LGCPGFGSGDVLTIVVGLEGGRCCVAAAWFDFTVKPAVVEPVDVFEGGELDVLEALPGPLG
jgi:hypothetical protein